MTELTKGDEVLFRQIHPYFFENGEPTSQAFTPTVKDAGKLSVDRSAITGAKESYELYTTTGRRSAAVYGLSVAEFHSHGIVCHADPIEQSNEMPANPAHAFAGFHAFAVNQQKIKAKRLKHVAIARGVLHS
jgi:hypothetical protein